MKIELGRTGSLVLLILGIAILSSPGVRGTPAPAPRCDHDCHNRKGPFVSVNKTYMDVGVCFGFADATCNVCNDASNYYCEEGKEKNDCVTYVDPMQLVLTTNRLIYPSPDGDPPCTTYCKGWDHENGYEAWHREITPVIDKLVERKLCEGTIVDSEDPPGGGGQGLARRRR